MGYYDPQHTDGNDQPLPFAREQSQKAQNSPSRVSPSAFEVIQGYLDQYAYYVDMPKPSTDKFPEIMAPGRHGVLTQWFHRAPFGQPRGVDLVTLRKLAESPFITMCKEARIDQVTSLPWDVVPLDPDGSRDKNCEDAYEFLRNPNQNQESFGHVMRSFLNDILDLDAGVLVKTFSGTMQETEYEVPETLKNSFDYQWEGETVKKLQPQRYTLKRVNGRLLKQVPQGGARLEEFFSRDGGSFVKDVDQYGITYGYWQYTYKYPAPAPIPFSDREIVYGMMSPRSFGPYGFSPLQSLQRILNVLVTQTLHAEKFYGEGGVPPGILALMNMDLSQFKIWQAYFYEEVAGNPHRIPMINPGMGGDAKWISFSPTQKDIQFLESQEWWLKVVAGVMKVNFNELGITDTVNRATSEEQSQIFQRRSIRPLLDLIEWIINLEIMQELWAMGMSGTKFKFIPEADSFEKSRRATIHTQQATLGLKTINEIRKEEGDEPVEWGDMPQWYLEFLNPRAPFDPFGSYPDGLPPSERPNQEEPDPGQEEPEPSQDGDETEDLQNAILSVLRSEGMLKAISKQEEPVEEPEPVGIDSFYGLANPSDLEEEDPRVVDVVPVQADFQHGLSLLFAEQELEILRELGVLERGVGIDTIRAALDVLRGKHLKALIDLIRTYIFKALNRGGNKAYQELRIEGTFEMRGEEAERFLQDYSLLLAKSKFIQVRDRIREILIRGLEEGHGATTIGNALKDEFVKMKGYEAERIARTETIRALNYGRELAYKKTNLVSHKQWLVTYDDRLCPFCYPLANQVVPLNADFITETHVRVQNPPLHPNCRCTILPVIREDARKTATGALYTPTNKMQELEEAYGKRIEELLPELLEEEKSLNQVAERLTKEGFKITQPALGNWARLLGIDTLPKGGDTVALRNKGDD